MPANGKNCDRGNNERATGKDKSDADGCKGGHSLRQIDARQAEPDNAGCHQQTYDSLQIEHPAWAAIGWSSHAINPCHRKEATDRNAGRRNARPRTTSYGARAVSSVTCGTRPSSTRSPVANAKTAQQPSTISRAKYWSPIVG